MGPSVRPRGHEWLEVCLRFANTANWHASPAPQEELRSYADLVRWAVRARLMGEEDGARLTARAAASTRAARTVLARAVRVREMLYRIFAALAHGRPPAAADLGALNRTLALAFRHSRLAALGRGFAWDVAAPAAALDRMLWPVIRSAADLLTSDSLQRVKQCADDRGCGWLFLDQSKNLSRRWCSMASCGNRAKAQRFYRRRPPAPFRGAP